MPKSARGFSIYASLLQEHATRTIRTLAVSGAALLFLVGAASVSAVTPSDDGTRLAPTALNSLSGPPDKIAYAAVVDDKGTLVGAVQRIELDANGKPSKVEFALLGTERIVALDSSKFGYDEPNNVLTAGLDKSQIVQLSVAPRG